MLMAAGLVLCGLAVGLLTLAVLDLKPSFLSSFIGRIEKKRRKAGFDNQLVDAIGMIGNSLKAGFSIIQGMDLVVKMMGEPVSTEFKALLNEVKLGVSLNDALVAFGERMKSDDLDLVINATLVSYETGGNLAEIYSRIAATIRERNILQKKVESLSAQGKLQGMIVGALPVVLLIVLNWLAPDMVYPLFHTGAGLLILACVVLLECMGAFFIRKITTIDV